jgi:hypothetical protein
METLLIVVGSLGVAYLSGRLAPHGTFTLADLATGIFGALIGLSMTQFLNGASGGGLELSLIFACGLTLGLASLRRRSSLHD